MITMTQTLFGLALYAGVVVAATVGICAYLKRSHTRVTQGKHTRHAA
ncbi:MAG: hypothetical protein ACOX4F_09225 [Atopobiaceae bacterium]|jgi:hypothetical protein